MHAILCTAVIPTALIPTGLYPPDPLPFPFPFRQAAVFQTTTITYNDSIVCSTTLFQTTDEISPIADRDVRSRIRIILYIYSITYRIDL